MNLLYCRSFILHTNYGQSSRPHNFKNGVAQGSVLAPTFAMFTLNDFPDTFNANLYRMGLADNKNCVCGDIQSASHILYHCTVMAPTCSITNTTNEDLIEYLLNSSF